MARGRPAKCPYCGGSSINKGFRKTKTLGRRKIKLCKACRRKFTPKNQSMPEAHAKIAVQADEAPPRKGPQGQAAPSPEVMLEIGEAPTQAAERPEPLLDALDQEWTS